MATYRVWLTVKDSYGNTKEVEGGTIDVDLDELSPEDMAKIEDALPLEDYIKRENLDTELVDYATDHEVAHAVNSAVQGNDAIKYGDFDLLDE